MASYTLFLAPAARNDLRDIYQYSELNWGTIKATSYLEKLQSQLWNLTVHPMMGLERTTFFANMRSLAVESHVIFYRLQDTRIEIVRVLHKRQDPLYHLDI
jgi:toxin ParE1/3/4